jgi:hypothetical protein
MAAAVGNSAILLVRRTSTRDSRNDSSGVKRCGMHAREGPALGLGGEGGSAKLHRAVWGL